MDIQNIDMYTVLCTRIFLNNVDIYILDICKKNDLNIEYKNNCKWINIFWISISNSSKNDKIDIYNQVKSLWTSKLISISIDE